MRAAKDQFHVSLECGHYRTLQLDQFSEGGNVYCIRCAAYRLVTTFDSVGNGYRFKCLTCRYARSFGMGKTSCDVSGSSHALRLRHTVVAFYRNVEYARYDHSGQMELPLPMEAPF